MLLYFFIKSNISFSVASFPIPVKKGTPEIKSQFKLLGLAVVAIRKSALSDKLGVSLILHCLIVY